MHIIPNYDWNVTVTKQQQEIKKIVITMEIRIWEWVNSVDLCKVSEIKGEGFPYNFSKFPSSKVLGNVKFSTV